MGKDVVNFEQIAIDIPEDNYVISGFYSKSHNLRYDSIVVPWYNVKDRIEYNIRLSDDMSIIPGLKRELLERLHPYRVKLISGNQSVLDEWILNTLLKKIEIGYYHMSFEQYEIFCSFGNGVQYSQMTRQEFSGNTVWYVSNPFVCVDLDNLDNSFIIDGYSIFDVDVSPDVFIYLELYGDIAVLKLLRKNRDIQLKVSSDLKTWNDLDSIDKLSCFKTLPANAKSLYKDLKFKTHLTSKKIKYIDDARTFSNYDKLIFSIEDFKTYAYVYNDQYENGVWKPLIFPNGEKVDNFELLIGSSSKHLSVSNCSQVVNLECQSKCTYDPHDSSILYAYLASTWMINGDGQKRISTVSVLKIVKFDDGRCVLANHRILDYSSSVQKNGYFKIIDAKCNNVLYEVLNQKSIYGEYRYIDLSKKDQKISHIDYSWNIDLQRYSMYSASFTSKYLVVPYDNHKYSSSKLFLKRTKINIGSVLFENDIKPEKYLARYDLRVKAYRWSGVNCTSQIKARYITDPNIDQNVASCQRAPLKIGFPLEINPNAFMLLYNGIPILDGSAYVNPDDPTEICCENIQRLKIMSEYTDPIQYVEALREFVYSDFTLINFTSVNPDKEVHMFCDRGSSEYYGKTCRVQFHTDIAGDLVLFNGIDHEYLINSKSKRKIEYIISRHGLSEAAYNQSPDGQIGKYNIKTDVPRNIIRVQFCLLPKK